MIIVAGTFAIMLVLIFLIFFLYTETGPSQTILTAVLPLRGASTGAVIAFYFSSKNLESATESVQNLVTGLSGKGEVKNGPYKR